MYAGFSVEGQPNVVDQIFIGWNEIFLLGKALNVLGIFQNMQKN